MLTSKEKTLLIDIIKQIDVKQFDIDHDNETYAKWFRFGNYNALQIVSEVIKQLPEEKKESQKITIKVS